MRHFHFTLSSIQTRFLCLWCTNHLKNHSNKRKVLSIRIDLIEIELHVSVATSNRNYSATIATRKHSDKYSRKYEEKCQWLLKFRWTTIEFVSIYRKTKGAARQTPTKFDSIKKNHSNCKVRLKSKMTPNQPFKNENFITREATVFICAKMFT